MCDDSDSRKRSKLENMDGLEFHDKAVVMNVTVDNEGSEVTASIRFLLLAKATTIAVEVVDMPRRTLAYLFPGDGGQESVDAGMLEAGAQDLTDSRYQIFMWAQFLAGLSCLPEQQSYRIESSSRNILSRIKERIRSCVVLESLIKQFSKIPRTISVHKSVSSFFPAPSPAVPILTGWTENVCSEEALRILPFGKVDAAMIQSRLFRASFSTSTAGEHVTSYASSALSFTLAFDSLTGQFEAHVLVHPAYPDIPPRFVVRKITDPATVNEKYDQSLKDVEVDVNSFFDEYESDDPLARDWLISAQLAQLQVIFFLIFGFYFQEV
jgi:hypothetical protein